MKKNCEDVNVGSILLLTQLGKAMRVAFWNLIRVLELDEQTWTLHTADA